MSSVEYHSEHLIHPKHRKYYQKFRAQSTQLLDVTHFTALQDPLELERLRNEARPEMDIFDTYLNIVRQKLDVSETAAFEEALSNLSKEIAKDLRVYVQEEYKLRHQTFISPVDTQAPLEEWEHLTQNSAEKAKVLLDGSETETEWIVNFVRLQRYLWENRQASEVQQFVREQLAEQSLQPVRAQELFGATTSRQLRGLHLSTSQSLETLDPGKLQDLGLTGEETILVSPKFFLAMPENRFVHSGDHSYVNLYQVVCLPATDEKLERFFLLADMYFSRLSLEELQETIELLLPEQELPSNLSEKLILETTGTLSDSFTTTPPFQLFLQLAAHLDKEVHGLQMSTAQEVIQSQRSARKRVASKDTDIQRAGTLLSHVLLTELAIMQYLPRRGEYVSEVLYRVFEIVIKALLNPEEKPLTDEVYTQILGFYHEHLLSLKEKQGQDTTLGEVLQPRTVRDRNNQALDRLLHPEERVQQRQRIRTKHQDLLTLGNAAVLGVGQFLPSVLTKTVGCAACGAGSFAQFGGLKEVGSSVGTVSQTAGSSLSASGLGFGGWGWPTPFRNSTADFSRSRDFFQRMDSFLGSSLDNGMSVMNKFRNSFISANDLLPYLISEQSILPHR